MGRPAVTRIGVVVGAVALGGAYALSPLTVWVTVALGVAVLAVSRQLEPGERRWFLVLMAGGIAIRVGVLSYLVGSSEPGATTNPSLFGDGSYAIGRSLWLRSAWLGEPIHPRYFMEAFEPYAAGGHNVVHAAVQVLVGPSPWALHVFAGGVFLAGAVLLFLLARRGFGSGPALMALAVSVLSPTWAAWSLTPIKDSLQFTAVVLVFTCTLIMLRRSNLRARLLAAMLTGAALAGVSTLRGVAVVSLGATVAAVIAWAVVVRWGTRVLLAGLAVAAVALVLAARADVQRTVLVQIDEAANRHLGHVRTEGTHFKLLDERLYRGPLDLRLVLTPGERTRFLVRSVGAFLAVPLPWQLEGLMVMYLPLQAAWYCLVVTAFVGLPFAWARHAPLTLMLAVYAVVSAAIIAPNSGNIGTLIRHRDAIVPFVACLSAVGIRALAGALPIRRPLAALAPTRGGAA